MSHKEAAKEASPGRSASDTMCAVDDRVIARLMREGWASFAGTLEDVTAHARHRGWVAVPMRRDDPVVSELRPLAASDARPNSLSSRTGMNAQPLHTDGAHLAQPPDIVALAGTSPHPTATRLWRVQTPDAPWDDLHHGIFCVSDGRRRSTCVAMVGRSVRFDPFCMSPCDGRARRVAAYFQSAFERSDRHEWGSSEPEVLLIDNRRTLHAREAVLPTDPPRLLHRIAFRYLETT